MKGYTDFMTGFYGAAAVATKPIGKTKYLNWLKAIGIIAKHPDAVIYAGLREDWNNTSGLIFAKGNFYNGYVYGASNWATPIVDVDGEEIECWTYTPTPWGATNKPDCFKSPFALDEWDYEED